jgi:hypothetical protein
MVMYFSNMNVSGVGVNSGLSNISTLQGVVPTLVSAVSNLAPSADAGAAEGLVNNMKMMAAEGGTNLGFVARTENKSTDRGWGIS